MSIVWRACGIQAPLYVSVCVCVCLNVHSFILSLSLDTSMFHCLIPNGFLFHILYPSHTSTSRCSVWNSKNPPPHTHTHTHTHTLIDTQIAKNGQISLRAQLQKGKNLVLVRWDNKHHLFGSHGKPATKQFDFCLFFFRFYF